MTEEATENPPPRTYTLGTVITVAFFALGLGLGAGYALGRGPRMAEQQPPAVSPESPDAPEKETGPR